MAKSGFTQDELKYFDSLSMEELDNMILSKRGLNSNASGQQAGQGSASVPMSERSNLDPAFQAIPTEQIDAATAEKYIAEMEEKYLDPNLLEARPAYADGSAPERAIMKAPSGAFWERTKLAFTNQPLEKQVKMLESEYGAGNVKLSKGKNLTVNQNGAWYQLDPSGAGQGDFMDKAYEKTQDILADNADIALSVGVGIPIAALAAPVVAGFTGLAAVGGALGVGAASGAGSGMARVLMGRLSGTYEATPEQMARDIGVETLLSMAGNAFIPGVKYTAQSVGKMFQKSAPVFASMPEKARNITAQILGVTSGVGDDNVGHWMNNAKKVGEFQVRHGSDQAAYLNASIQQTKELAKSVVGAKIKYGQKLYGDFAEEAGSEFTPWVGKIFTGSNANETGIELMSNNTLKYKNGKLFLASLDELPVENTFAKKETRDVIQPVLDVINDFNKRARPASGPKGAEQYLAFKERLNAAMARAEAKAMAPGRNELLALGEVRKLKADVMTAYVNKAVDPTRAPELASKLAKIDGEYAKISVLTDKFQKASAKGGNFDDEPYRALYEDLFARNKITSKTVVNKSEIQQMTDLLGKFDSRISEAVDDIGARKAAEAANHWLRPGMTSNVQTSAGMAAGIMSSNPLTGLAVAGVGSPKVNAKAAKMMSSLIDGLDFVRKLPANQRIQMLKTPEAIQKFYSTILSVPGIEAQTGAQLRGVLEGNQNGQQ